MTAPERPPVSEQVIQAIEKVKGNLSTPVTLDSSFEQLGIDSLDAIEILFEVEERFGVAVPNDAIKVMRTVRDVVQGVEQLLAGGKPATKGTSEDAT